MTPRPGFTPFAGAPIKMNRSRPGARTRKRKAHRAMSATAQVSNAKPYEREMVAVMRTGHNHKHPPGRGARAHQSHQGSAGEHLWPGRRAGQPPCRHTIRPGCPAENRHRAPPRALGPPGGTTPRSARSQILRSWSPGRRGQGTARRPARLGASLTAGRLIQTGPHASVTSDGLTCWHRATPLAGASFGARDSYARTTMSRASSTTPTRKPSCYNATVVV